LKSKLGVRTESIEYLGPRERKYQKDGNLHCKEILNLCSLSNIISENKLRRMK
jgi:hypothetical protein